MGDIAKDRGINVIKSSAENLPIEDNSYDFVLLTTTICFLDDIKKSFLEIYRILEKNGNLIVAFVDLDSHLEKLYNKKKQNSKFYKYAKFYSVKNVEMILKECGFTITKIAQTLYKDNLKTIENGFGKGGFVSILAKK